MDNLFWIGFVGAALALIFAYLQKCKVMKCSEGDEKMVKIASSIRAGANAYLKQQYSTVAKVFAVVFVILLIIAFASKGQMLSRVTPFAFLTGGIWSMLAGLIGMKIATAANARTANAAHESLNHGLNVAFSSGTVTGFTVVGLGILDITLWFIGLRYIGKITDPTVLANIMVMNGMGASSWRCLPVSAAVSTPRLLTSAPTSSVKSKPVFRKMTRVTPRPSRTTSAITSATLPVWALTCTSPMSAPSLPPSR